MKVQIVSDLHFEKHEHNEVYQGYALSWLKNVIERRRPDALAMLGDSGYAWTAEDLRELVRTVRVSAIFGNHDDVRMLNMARNTNGTPVLASDGERREMGGMTFGFINGIIGHRMRDWIPRKREEEFFSIASSLRGVDVMCTHDSPLRDARINPFTHTKSTVYDAILAANPSFAFSGHVNRDFTLTMMGRRTLHVHIDSSAKSQCYAILDTEKKKVSLWHADERKSFLEYVHSGASIDNSRRNLGLLGRLRRDGDSLPSKNMPVKAINR